MASERTRNKTTKKPPDTGKDTGSDRDAKGRYLLGHSPNPGGMTKTQREAREAFMQGIPRAWQIIGEWLESDDTERVKVALETIFTRALGRPPKAAELPLLVPKPEGRALDGDPARQAADVRALLADVILELRHRVEMDGAGTDLAQTLVTVGKGLADIRKTEAEAQAASKAGSMTDGELLEAVIAKLGPDAVAAALARMRSTAPAPAAGT